MAQLIDISVTTKFTYVCDAYAYVCNIYYTIVTSNYIVPERQISYIHDVIKYALSAKSLTDPKSRHLPQIGRGTIVVSNTADGEHPILLAAIGSLSNGESIER
jgi:hypothetical protein